MDIGNKIGLEIKLNSKNRLEIPQEVKFDGESIRKLSDLKLVVADESLDLSDMPAYYMYRNVHKKKDEKVLQENALRFDLTVILPATLGDEFIKTSGHYHPEKPGTGLEYPELYYVISGQATYLMQRHEKDGSISDVILSRVKPGQAVMIPLGYGHVTINELDKPLVMANWVEASFKSEYGDYETKRGAAYYLKTDGSIVRNPNYQDVASLREMEADPQCLSGLAEKAIYNYIDSPRALKPVAKPEDYPGEFEVDKLFK